MKFVDPIPPARPTREEQRDALQKGLGRAMQWAMAGVLEDDPLLQACLIDLRYDWQVDLSRALWLWQLIQAVNGQDRFREPILEELLKLTDETNADQLCELGYFYAASGDERFRKRLYEIVEQCPFPMYDACLGEEEILQLDGVDALIFVASVHGTHLESRYWESDDESLINRAIEVIGEDAVLKLLESSSDEMVKRFFNRWRAWKKSLPPTGGNPHEAFKQRMQSIAAEEIIAQVETGKFGEMLLTGWGKHASDNDLRKVVDALWSAENPKVIVNYLRIFSIRALPNFDARLIQLCRHSDEDVYRWAFNALEKNSHPLVREFAIGNIRKGLRDVFFGKLLIRNYVSGDEDLILEALELPDVDEETHCILMDIIKVLENNPEADPSKLALIVYAKTPCTECRFKATELLHARNFVPRWMLAECRFDCEVKCQNLFLPKSSESSPENQ